jgi:hypothetical protein
LHELFPDEIPLLLDNILAVCNDIQTNRDLHAQKWDFGLMSFDMWVSLAQNAERAINKYRKSLEKSSKVFAEQLFHSWDYTVIFVNDRICKYATQSDNAKFKLAIALLFEA